MDIPDRFVDGAENGFFPAYDFQEWLENEADEDTQQYFREVFDDSSLSAEWGVLLASQDVTNDYASWEGVTIARDDAGDWTAIIHADGEDHVYKFPDDDTAIDLIWADLYFHLQDEGVEFDKDIHSVGGD